MAAPHETIARIHRVFRGGSGAPACVETENGDAYVLKLKGAGGGERGLLTELLGLRIAAMMGVRVPAARAIHLPDGFPWQAGTDEFDSMLQRSYGWNLGVAFIPDATEVKGAELDALSGDFLAPLARADVLLVNVDRPGSNPNLLRDAVGGYWAIDYGACLFLNRILQGRLERPIALPPGHFLARTPFDRIAQASLSATRVRTLISETPDEWLGDLPIARAELADRLTAYITA